MPAGLPVALVLLAQAGPAQGYGPPGPPPSAPPTSSRSAAERECAPQSSAPKSNEIVVCAVKPEGYRLPPDIVEARRLKKQGDTVRPHNPHEAYRDNGCARVGPGGCITGPAINMLAVAATAAEISKRLAKGQEVGSVFETTPHPSEYQLYLEAKKRREAKEAEAAAKKAQAAARAANAAHPGN